ncbi:PREDICTED: uncharacterized protein LOC106818628 [Priapulus caudatus]|uniref:Uncharacterized protein LOC106818628 n=1 Tax=Priapulus caudatus TaxID=37621 RepID=A0ABM1F2Y4_PRICU|nr:PREDICTED: uncharacterized protein LOC106818628 [Priapulus caudatus]
MEELLKKKRMRGGHRAYDKKVMTRVSTWMAESTTTSTSMPSDSERRLTQHKAMLTEKLATVQRLDEEILEIMSEKEDMDIEVEVEEAGTFRVEVQDMISRIHGWQLVPNEREEQGATEQPVSELRPVSSARAVRPKLPKLEVRKFNGKVHEWQGFWDCYESAIHGNECLSDVDKFTYLRGLVEEPAKSAIAGFALTSANYQAAVELLKERYGKKNIIQRAHVNELLNIAPVFSERDTVRLRGLCDTVETHYRGLKALGLPEETYSSIVVPAIMEKIPVPLRLTVTRGREYLDWTMKDLLDALSTEVGLREEHQVQPPQRMSQADRPSHGCKGKKRAPAQIC